MTNEPRAGKGLDPEMLAAYIDKRLPPDERAVVEAKLAADPESYELLVELIHANEALKDQLPQDGEVKEGAERDEPQARTGAVVPMVPKPRRTGGWMIAGGVLAAAAAVALVVRLQPELWQRVRGGDAVDPRLAQLVAAVGEERYIEARLTGGFKYGPLRSVTRGPSDLSTQNLALLAAAGGLQDAVRREPTAANLRAWGTAQLLLKDYDGAIDSLRQASESEVSGRHQSDLAAALLERAVNGGSAADLPAALDAAESALALEPGMVEALFNRAMALELLGLSDQAVAAWRAYLDVDANGPWAVEARAHLDRLAGSQSSVDPFRSPDPRAAIDDHQPGEVARIRFLAERDWLIRSCSPAVTAADQRRAAAKAEEYRGRTGDGSLLVLVNAQRTANACSAYRSYAEAMARLDADDLPQATEALARVSTLLGGGESPLRLWADYHLAAIGNLARDFDRAGAELQRVTNAASSHGYVSLEAHALWTQGVVYATNNDFRRSLSFLTPALVKAKQAFEPVLEGRLQNQLAENYEYLGDSRQAWTHRAEALLLAKRFSNRRLRHSVYGSLAAVSLRRGMPLAARTFLEAQYRANAQGAPPASRLTLLLRQAESDLASGDVAAAGRRLDDAQAALSEMGADPRTGSLKGRLLLTRARHALQAEQPSTAVALTSEALPSFDRGRDLQAIDALLLRARAWHDLGKPTEARTDAAKVLDLLGSRRAGGASFFGSPELTPVEAGFDQLLETADSDDALRLAAATRKLTSPVPFQGDGSESPQGATLYFKVLPARIRAWMIVDGTVHERSLALGRTDAVRLVKSVLAASESTTGSARPVEDLEKAFTVLLIPFDAQLARQPLLRIVADWPLDGLPFGALRNPGTRRFVAEDHAIVMAPTLSPSPRRVASRAPAADLLVVANPDRGSDSEGGLPPLPWAEREGALVSGLYARVVLLLGNEATPRALLANAPRARVVHVAAHAIVDRVDGRRSRLLLAGDREGRGDLFGEQLVQQAWEGIDTVVLAACATAEPDRRPSSPLTLATQVLAAGPRFVIATLRPIDDRLASAFFFELHRLLATGVPAPEALQRTQVSFIQGGQSQAQRQAAPLAMWSPIAVFGS